MWGVGVKKIFIIGTMFLLVLATMGVVSSRRQPARPAVSRPTPTPELALLAAPVFPPSVVANQPAYVVPALAASFPEHVPDHEVSPFSVKDAAGAVARALGFPDAPQGVSGSRGTSYVWSAGASSLVVSGNPPMVAYLSGKTTAGVVVSSAASLDAAARAVLARLDLPAAPYELVKLPPRYFTTSGQDLVEVNGAAGATIVEVGYRYYLSSRPVYGSRPNEPSAATRFNAKEEIVSVTAAIFSPTKESGKSVAVALGEEVSGRLARSEGVLLYLFADGDKNNFTAPQYAVPVVSVGSVSLGYYYSPGASSLSPVFLAEGVGQDGGSGQGVRFMTLVSALR
jgi:hypothetical protein